MEYCVSIRRHLHRNPEVGHQEFRTAAFIREELGKLDVAYQTFADTGTHCVLDSGRCGPTIAIRADIDALPLQEEGDAPYASAAPGVMHACGHDGHAAILLGLGRSLKQNLDRARGRVVLIFQPAEECPPGGALDAIGSGALRGADFVLGLHLSNQLPLGRIGMRQGKLMASVDRFSVEVVGKGGHPAMPHLTVNALSVGAHLVTALEAIPSQRIDPLEPAILAVTTFHAGTGFNIVPEKAVVTGTVRAFSEEVRDRLEHEVRSRAAGLCSAMGALCHVSYERGYPVLTCDPRLVARMKERVTEELGGESVVDLPMLMGSDDFAHYGRVAPSAYFVVGSGNPDRGYLHELHNPKFDFDEAAMVVGVCSLLAILAGLWSDPHIAPEAAEPWPAALPADATLKSSSERGAP